MLIKKNTYMLFGLLSAICLCNLSAAQTELKIKNLSDNLLKIEQIEKILVLADGTRLQDPVVKTGNKTFLGAYAPIENALPFAWIERGIAWERYLYRISPQGAHAGFPIDLLFECGSGWSFLLAKSGGEWQNLFTRQAAAVAGTNLWIKAGATVVTVDKPERNKMQIGPRITCQVSCMIEGLDQNYLLTFADDGNPEVYAQRLLKPGMRTVLLENQTAGNWRVTIDGVTPQEKHLNLGPKEIDTLFSLAPDPAKRTFENDTVTISLLAPHNTAHKNFYLVFKRVKTDAEPRLFVGPTPHRVSQSLFVPGVFIQITKSPGQIRYTLTTDAAAGLKQELIDAIKAHRAGTLAIPQLKDAITRIMAAAPEKLKLSPIKFSLDEFKSAIINVLDDQGMTPVLWFGNNREMVDFFAKQGADLRVQDNQLLYYAIGAQATDVITDLLARGLLPGVRHLVFAQATNRAIATMLVTNLIGRIVNEKNENYLTILAAAVPAILKEGNTDFAYWMANTLRDTIAQKGPEAFLAQSNLLVDKTTAACPEKAPIELQLQRDDLSTGLYLQQSHKSIQVPYHGTSGYITVDSIGKTAHEPVVRDYSLFFHGMHVATIRFEFAPNGNLTATVKPGETGSTVTQTSPDHYHLEFGDKEADLSTLSVKEGGITKGKIYVEREMTCEARAAIELVNQRAEFAVWAERLTAAGDRAGITVGLDGAGQKTIDTFCLPGRASRDRYYKIFIFGEPIAIVKCIFFADGTATAQIRATDFNTVLQSTSNLNQGWNLAGGIGRGIRQPFTMPGNSGSITAEAINPARIKIWIQAAGLPLQ